MCVAGVVFPIVALRCLLSLLLACLLCAACCEQGVVVVVGMTVAAPGASMTIRSRREGAATAAGGTGG